MPQFYREKNERDIMLCFHGKQVSKSPDPTPYRMQTLVDAKKLIIIITWCMRIRKYAHKHFPRYNGGNLQYLGFRSITSVFMDESQPVSAMSSSIMSTTYVVETSYCKRHLNCKLPVHSTSRIVFFGRKQSSFKSGLLFMSDIQSYSWPQIRTQTEF